MTEINLLREYPKAERPIEARGKRKLSGGGWLEADPEKRDNTDVLVDHHLLSVARRFGCEYFDGDRLYGYGGYHYDPRFWTGTVRLMREHYGLSENAFVLDVGCAKGFMLYDFMQLMPKAEVAGLDISEYALEHAIEVVKPFLTLGNAKQLPYPDGHFDLVVSINTVDHLSLGECKLALAEIQRVSKRNAFISVNAWRTSEERDRLLRWNLTALTSMHVDDWKAIFADVGYTGDCWWFIP